MVRVTRSHRSGWSHPVLAITLVVLTGVLLAAQGPPPQPPRPLQAPSQAEPQMPPVTFRVEVNYVEVDVVVQDEQGRFVRSLSKDDFEVYEDGGRQTVADFGLVNIPLEVAARPLFAKQPIEPDVQSNARPFDGRLYLLLLDDLHTAPNRSGRVRAAARQFIERNLGANDLAAVTPTSGRTDASQDFTGNRSLLLAAVDKFVGRKLRSSTLNRLDAYYLTRDIRSSSDPITDPEEFERVYNARNSLSAVRQVSEYLANVRGRRKAIVFFSEGIDYNIYDPFSNPNATEIIQETRSLISAATRANVSVYAIDPRGLTDLGGEAMEMGAPAEDPTLGLSAEGLRAELRISQDSLRTLADETGGFAAVNRNDFTDAFLRIRDENSTYYVLGYYSTNDKRDGGFRRIEVKALRPGLRVRARPGYYAARGAAPFKPEIDAKEGTPEALRETLGSPLPVTGLRLSIFAAPFRGTPPNASVAVVVQAAGSDLTFTEKDGRFEGTLELSFVAVDHSGKVRGGNRLTVNMPLRPETFKAVSRSGLRVVDRLELAPGRYQIRLAGADPASGRLGSVYYDLVVPDFSAAPLVMSGLVLTSTRAGLIPTPTPDEELKRMLPGPPTTARDFIANDEIALAAEVYDNQAKTPHDVDIRTSVLANDGREVFSQQDQRSSSELQGGRGGYGYTARVPLKGLQPGLYLLKVEARSRIGAGSVASREVLFRIVQPQ